MSSQKISKRLVHRQTRGHYIERLERRSYLSTVVTVPGEAAPWDWNSTLNSDYEFGVSVTTTPVVISASSGVAFAAGDSLSIQYLSGLASANFGSPSDANGFVGQYSDTDNGSSGRPFPSFYVSPADYPAYLESLIGTFADSSGNIVGMPFLVGDSRSVTVPDGATQLQLGANDDLLYDNFGSWQISVSPGRTPTSVNLGGLPATVSAGAAINLTADVSKSAGAAAPTGTVTFAVNGQLIGTTAVAANGTATFAGATLPAGNDKLTVAYTGDSNFSFSASQRFVAVTAVASIGKLDPGFGGGGIGSHDVGFGTTNGIAADGSQSVLIGPIGTAPDQSFGLTRYNADGSLDTTFGSGGVVSTAFGDTDAVPSVVAVLSDGDIVVPGSITTYSNGVASGSQYAVAEYLPSGALNTAFGNGGTTVFGFAGSGLSNDLVSAIAIGPTGIIYLAGSSDANSTGNPQFALAALTPSGALDTAFGTGGKLLLGSGGNSIQSLVVQKNGDIVAAGSATVGGVVELALMRFVPTGKIDDHFGTHGMVEYSAGVYDGATSVILQTNGDIVVGGTTASGSGASLTSNFLLQRYTVAGRLDRAFAGGTVTTNFGQPSAASQLLLQSNGDIVISGKTTASLSSVNPEDLDVAIALYTSFGKLDTTFNQTGKQIVSLSAGVVSASAIESADVLVIAPLDAASLGSGFDDFVNSNTGVVEGNPGGEITVGGQEGSMTVAAKAVTVGVDLVTSFLLGAPPSILGGAKGKIEVKVVNNGNMIARGAITVDLTVSDVDSGTSSDVRSFPESISATGGRYRVFNLAFVYPASLPASQYYFQATVVPGSTIVDYNAPDATSVSVSPVTISPPFINLSGSGLAAGALTPGKSANVTLDVTNNGNVIAKGKTIVEIFLSPDQSTADGTQIASVNLSLSLAAGKSRVYPLRFKLPASSTAGTFSLLAILDPLNSLGGDDSSDVTVLDPTSVSVT